MTATDEPSVLAALVESTAWEWTMILSLVFGGCCSNVWALESVLKQYPASGTFLTFAQFLYVAITSFFSQVHWPKGSTLPRWRRNKIPIRRWAVQVVLFFLVNWMNNYAFDLKIPVTVHIIFRSGGLCVSMLVGWMTGKRRYTVGQVAAGIIITIGIVLATISAPRPPRTKPTGTVEATDAGVPDTLRYAAGIGLLALALFLSAWLGLWQEATYATYGKQWREALFYQHFLSLPLFLPMASTISTTFRDYASSAPVTLLKYPVGPHQDLSDPFSIMSSRLTVASPLNDVQRELFKWRELVVPSALLALLTNVVTQGLCVRGVNRLTTRVSSTTVNLILTLRKAASLAISVAYYHSGVSNGLLLGGVMVLGGTVLYSVTSPSGPPREKRQPSTLELRENGAREKPLGVNGSTAGSQPSTGTSTTFNLPGGEELRRR